jgi:hypothetical protein
MDLADYVNATAFMEFQSIRRVHVRRYRGITYINDVIMGN